MDLTALQHQFVGSEWPEFVSVTQLDQAYLIELNINPEVSWFAGHFPEQPVLPGIVQTHWAGCLSQTLFNLQHPFSNLHNLKFQTMILPHTAVTLKLQFDYDKYSVTFSYFNNDIQYSGGRLTFAA